MFDEFAKLVLILTVTNFKCRVVKIVIRRCHYYIYKES